MLHLRVVRGMLHHHIWKQQQSGGTCATQLHGLLVAAEVAVGCGTETLPLRVIRT